MYGMPNKAKLDELVLNSVGYVREVEEMVLAE
jgi:hypothetical protein